MYGACGVVLAAFAAAIALDDEFSVRTKSVEELVLVIVPAAVLALGAVPLQRASHSRTLLIGAGFLAAVTAVLVSMLTFGAGIPIAACLLAVAIADFVRARHLRTRLGSDPSHVSRGD